MNRKNSFVVIQVPIACPACDSQGMIKGTMSTGETHTLPCLACLGRTGNKHVSLEEFAKMLFVKEGPEEPPALHDVPLSSVDRVHVHNKELERVRVKNLELGVCIGLEMMAATILDTRADILKQVANRRDEWDKKYGKD